MKLKRIGTARRRAASSRNAFAIATFSSFFLFLPERGAQQPRRVRHQMYTRGSVKCAATIIDPQISPTPPLILQGVKKCDFGLITQQRSTLSRCGLETEQDISTVFKLRMQRLSEMFPPNLVQIGPRVF